MERRNYFDMLGLDFDPPEKDEKKIQRATAAWKKKLEDMRANETDKTRRSALTAELDLHDKVLETLKDKKTRNDEAHALKKQRTAQLEQLIKVMLVGQTGTLEVTNAQIRNVQRKLRLSPATIENIYKKKGFVIREPEKAVDLGTVFLSTTILKNISNKIDQLRSMSIPKYPWTSKVFNLFDLACYFSGGTDADASGFWRKRADDLYSIMEKGTARFASDMSDQGHLLCDLFTAGKEQVFDSETNRKKYIQSLEREKLREFFSLLKSAPDDFKRDPYFADNCIKTIQRSFPDYNLALTLYNLEAGMMQDPYEPIEALIHVTCGACRTPMEFKTREEAEKGRCTVCGKELYVTCPSPGCGRKVPAAADWCSCGFHISEMQFFDEYFNAAQFFLKEMDLPKARRQLANAENACPGHPKLALLRKQLQAETMKFQKPLDDLKALINAGQFSAAQKMLETLSSSMPQLKLDSQRQTISAKLSEAKRLMPGPDLPDSVRANCCVDILESVKDYRPAIDILSSCRPGIPANIHGAISSKEPLTCTLTWNSAGDKGVSYCVVRKKNGIPQRHSDGDMLAAELNVLEYRDNSIQPGVSYGYGVFAHRRGVYSDPAICEVKNFSELDVRHIGAAADNSACHFSWVLPTNCIGVRILRCTNAIPPEVPSGKCTVIAERAAANFIDTSVSNNVTYGYRLQCVYPYGSSLQYSKGYTVMLTPEQPPLALKNITVKTEDKTVHMRWNAPDSVQRVVMVKETTASPDRSVIGRILPASDINTILGNGKVRANTVSTEQHCQFDILPNTSVTLAVVITSGDKGIICEITQVSSVEKCRISRNETRMEGSRLKIILQNRPKYLEKIHYIAAPKTDSTPPWAAVDDARRGMLQVISLDDYIKDGMILVESPPKSDLYISVIGQYRMGDGSVVFSETSGVKVNNRPRQVITYRLVWATALLSSRPRRRNCRLYVAADAEDTPELKFVCQADGHIPMQMDPRTVVLHTIPETDTGFPEGQYVYTFPDSTWDQMKTGTELRLMLSENDMAEYELIPEDIASLRVPPK